MYSLIPEKSLRLVYEPFCLAIRRLFKIFYESVNYFHQIQLHTLILKFIEAASHTLIDQKHVGQG